MDLAKREAMTGLKIETVAYLDPKGSLSKRCKHKISKAELVRGYEIMVTSRYVDERMITLQRQGTITFALAAYGEEAAIVASTAALKGEDWIYPQYREVGAMWWRGMTIQDYMHHMFCNAKDPILGRQMPNHFGSRALNVVTVS
ncbi:MAG: thiamine pyrophosphate-dependent dehydrogenase E1 component subunit alpha, partial [Chlamydiia bacterium]|nr:thiamine pyrophosphate-dependent dehydrogenase E1 component subunit alpha [Chlamydiia bacterium]